MLFYCFYVSFSITENANLDHIFVMNSASFLLYKIAILYFMNCFCGRYSESLKNILFLAPTSFNMHQWALLNKIADDDRYKMVIFLFHHFFYIFGCHYAVWKIFSFLLIDWHSIGS